MRNISPPLTALFLLAFMLSPVKPYRQRAEPVDGFLVKHFGSQNLSCGGGWTFPVLLDGNRPIGACILKVKAQNVFGGQF